MSKEYRVSYEQFFAVEAESAQEAVDFVYNNLVKPIINSNENKYHLLESAFISFDEEDGSEYLRDDYSV